MYTGPGGFDYGDPAAGTTEIYFEWYPAHGARCGRRDGGDHPGWTRLRLDGLPRGLSRHARVGDRRPQCAHRRPPWHREPDAVKCTPLQNWKPSQGNQAYIDAVGACATQLNTTRRRPDGYFVRGAELYTTANAARDIAHLLNRLQTGRIDLYGDSYGTYFGQVFTSRYASMLRSVTLDAAYPVLGADPFYPDAIVRARHAFNRPATGRRRATPRPPARRGIGSPR